MHSTFKVASPQIALGGDGTRFQESLPGFSSIGWVAGDVLGHHHLPIVETPKVGSRYRQ